MLDAIENVRKRCNMLQVQPPKVILAHLTKLLLIEAKFVFGQIARDYSIKAEQPKKQNSQ